MGKVHRLFLDERPEALGLSPLSTSPTKLKHRSKIGGLAAADLSVSLHARLPAAAEAGSDVADEEESSEDGEEAAPPSEHVKILACKTCATHLSHTGANNVISTSFHGHYGKAWLMRTVFNTLIGQPARRTMTTGVHVVADLTCVACQATVGWKYLKAFESSQRYKEGSFILEIGLVSMKKAEV
ncbi:hypothetical protein BC830DRAFT_1129727 [Chytriomyces sp. MP71]|nr:hypothetical protein BC830DRAFT_1129727 [Chytriomyces sp. MP71]